MKSHLRPCCPSAEGNTPSFYRSPVSLKLPMMLLCKGTCAPVVPLFERAGGKCLRHAPLFRRPWQHTNRVGIDVFSIRDISLIQTQHHYPAADLVSPDYIVSINQKYIQSKSSLRMPKKFIYIAILSIYVKNLCKCMYCMFPFSMWWNPSEDKPIRGKWPRSAERTELLLVRETCSPCENSCLCCRQKSENVI